MIAGWLAKQKVPRWIAGLMPVVIIPLVTTFLVGGLTGALGGGLKPGKGGD